MVRSRSEACLTLCPAAALMHCTLPWTSLPHTRTTLFFKYTSRSEHYSRHLPRQIDYSRSVQELLPFPDVGERMAALLEAGAQYGGVFVTFSGGRL